MMASLHWGKISLLNDFLRIDLPDKCVSLVLEDADLLYGTKIGESLLQQLF